MHSCHREMAKLGEVQGCSSECTHMVKCCIVRERHKPQTHTHIHTHSLSWKHKFTLPCFLSDLCRNSCPVVHSQRVDSDCQKPQAQRRCEIIFPRHRHSGVHRSGTTTPPPSLLQEFLSFQSREVHFVSHDQNSCQWWRSCSLKLLSYTQNKVCWFRCHGKIQTPISRHSSMCNLHSAILWRDTFFVKAAPTTREHNN